MYNIAGNAIYDRKYAKNEFRPVFSSDSFYFAFEWEWQSKELPVIWPNDWVELREKIKP